MTVARFSKYFALVLILVLSTACYSYRVFPKEYGKLERREVPRRAYIINAELKKEVAILLASEIFKITCDSLVDTHIRLYPLKQSWVCGQPLTASILTLGQVPILLHDSYQFSFAEVKPDRTIYRDIELTIAQRVWFWDMFVFNKNFEEKAGKVLFGNYLKTIGD